MQKKKNECLSIVLQILILDHIQHLQTNSTSNRVAL